MTTLLKVKLNNAYNFRPNEREKLDRCCVKLEVIVNHPEFKAELQRQYDLHKFYGEISSVYHSKLKSDFELLWGYIHDGKERLLPEVDNEIDVDITIAWGKRGVVGWTWPSTMKTWINRRFFSYYSDKGVCSNIMHEWLHKLEFDHDYKRTNRRPYSICYMANHCVEKTYDLLWPKDLYN